MEEERDIPVEPAILQREVVRFEGDELVAARADSGIYISVRGLCEAIGISYSSQLQRMKRTKNLARGLRIIELKGKRGVRPLACLRLDKIAIWLIGVETERIADERVAAKIDHYQEDLEPAVLNVFMQHFAPTTAIVPSPIHSIEPATATMSDVIDFLREHLDMSFGRVDNQLDYIVQMLEYLVSKEDSQDTTIAKIDERTKALSPAHKYAIKRMVDAIVIQANVTYVQVYGPIKHHFHVTKYAEIADERFDEVVAFLTELSQKLISPDTPLQQNLF